MGIFVCQKNCKCSNEFKLIFVQLFNGKGSMSVIAIKYEGRNVSQVKVLVKKYKEVETIEVLHWSFCKIWSKFASKYTFLSATCNCCKAIKCPVFGRVIDSILSRYISSDKYNYKMLFNVV